MLRRHAVAAILAAFTCLAPAGAAQAVHQQGANATAARAATDKAWDDMISAATTGNAATLAASYTPDALIVDPYLASVSGRDAIERSYTESLKLRKFLGMTRLPAAFAQYSEDTAIENGTYSQSFQEIGKPVTKIEARYNLVWKNVDGRWLLHRNIATPLSPTAR
jgi:uncharacterized protein (TIGR02246 family)